MGTFGDKTTSDTISDFLLKTNPLRPRSICQRTPRYPHSHTQKGRPRKSPLYCRGINPMGSAFLFFTVAFKLAPKKPLNNLEKEWTELQHLARSSDVQSYFERWNRLWHKCRKYKIAERTRGEALLESLETAQEQDKIWVPLAFQDWISWGIVQSEAFNK